MPPLYTHVQSTLKNVPFRIVSDIDIRSEVTKRYLLKNPDKTYLQAVRSTEGSVQVQLKKLISQTIQELQEEDFTSVCIYVDRAYTPV
jgi:hypothetical protein